LRGHEFTIRQGLNTKIKDALEQVGGASRIIVNVILLVVVIAIGAFACAAITDILARCFRLKLICCSGIPLSADRRTGSQSDVRSDLFCAALHYIARASFPTLFCYVSVSARVLRNKMQTCLANRS
jgi:hypothetical protein